MAQKTAESAPDTPMLKHPAAPLGGAALLALSGCAIAVAGAPAAARRTVGWYTLLLAVLLCLVLALALWQVSVAQRQAREAERRRAEAERRSTERAAELAALQSDALALADDVLPSAVRQLRERASAQTVLAAAATPDHPALRRLLESTVEALYRERRTLTAAMAVLQESAYRVQAAVTDQLAEIQQRKAPYWERTGTVPRVTVRADFEALDARLTHMGLLTQRLMTLTGARRTGRQWPRPVALERVLRAAVGSTEDYGRVELLIPATPPAVSSAAVNPAIHVLAELTDNALRFSSPTTVVRVTAEDVPAGVIVYIDDSGLLMSEETLRRARRAVDPDSPLEISSLSGNRLGLAAAGASARRFGFIITFSRSPSQGTRATVLIPQRWLTTEVPDESAAPVPPARPAAAVPAGTTTAAAPATPAAVPAARPAPRDTPADEAGLLPKRRPGATLDEEARAARSEPSGHAPTRSPQETEHRLSGFRAAVRRTDAADDHSESSR